MVYRPASLVFLSKSTFRLLIKANIYWFKIERCYEPFVYYCHAQISNQFNKVSICYSWNIAKPFSDECSPLHLNSIWHPIPVIYNIFFGHESISNMQFSCSIFFLVVAKLSNLIVIVLQNYFGIAHRVTSFLIKVIRLKSTIIVATLWLILIFYR